MAHLVTGLYSDSKVEDWLTDHKIPNPGNLDGSGLRQLVKDNYDSAYDKWYIPPFFNIIVVWLLLIPFLVLRSDSDLQAYIKKYSIPTSSGKPREKIVDTIRRSYHGAVDLWADSDLKGIYPNYLHNRLY